MEDAPCSCTSKLNIDDVLVISHLSYPVHTFTKQDMKSSPGNFGDVILLDFKDF